MMRSRKPWVTKLHPEQKPSVHLDARTGRSMLIPTPMQVAAAIRRVPRGRVRTAPALRETLARESGADFACPLTTGIFLSIVSAADEELRAAGKRPLAPWWRIVGERGELNPKWPPGVERQASLLRAEGQRPACDPRTGRWRVTLPAAMSPGKRVIARAARARTPRAPGAGARTRTAH